MSKERLKALEDVAAMATVGATYPELMEYLKAEIEACELAQSEPVEPALEKEVSDLEACVRKFALEREELLVEVNWLKSQPDCRTCDHKFVDGWGHDICARSDCTNGDKYQPSKRLVLWAAAKGGAL